MEASVYPPRHSCLLDAHFSLQMWTNARSLWSLHVTISVSTVWAHSAASVALDTSCQDTAASVSRLQPFSQSWKSGESVLLPIRNASVVMMHFPDINECTRNVCPANKECRNTDGGYQCFDSCPAGMTKAETGACVGECSQYRSSFSFIHLSKGLWMKTFITKLI